MADITSITKNGKLYIKKEKVTEWETVCYNICEKSGLGEVGVEIIKDSIETMRLLEETTMSVENIIKTVSGSWRGKISALILETIVREFSKSSRFVEEWDKLKEKFKQGIPFDELLMKKTKR